MNRQIKANRLSMSFEGGFRRVVFFAQMGQCDPLHSTMNRATKNICRLLVGQMATASSYSPLEMLRIWPVFKHADFVVALQISGIHGFEQFSQKRKRMTQIGEDSQTTAIMLDNEAHRIDSVVRSRHRVNCHSINADRFTRPKVAHLIKSAQVPPIGV